MKGDIKMNIARGDKVLYCHRKENGELETMKAKVEFVTNGVVKLKGGKKFTNMGVGIADVNEWIEEIKG
jgi:hypothetical protein